MHSRRRFIAAAAAFVASIRSGLAGPRSVYDLSTYAFVTKPYWMSCDDPAVQRNGSRAVVELRCRTLRGTRIPKRGGTVSMDATVEYAESEDVIGSCTAATRVKKVGTVTLSCDVALPEEPTLPIEVSGNGPGISETFRLPGGTLVFETTATPDPEWYRSLSVNFSYGERRTVWTTEDPATLAEAVYIDEICDALIDTSVEGPWRVVIREAFPS